MLVIQALSVAYAKQPVTIYDLGIYGAVSCWALLAVIFVQFSILSQSQPKLGPITPFILRVLQLALVTFTGFANLSIPRRPAVFDEGRPVDAMDTETALSKYTFAWAAPILNLAGKKGTLDLNDLPRLNHNTRSKDVTKAWIEANRSGSLVRRVLLNHKWAFALQWFLTLLQAFGNFAPQFALLNILRILERRESGRPISSEAWIWVIALGLTTVVSSWIEAWLYWCSAGLSLPIRAELSTLVFEKSMRRKDVKGTTKTNTADSNIVEASIEEGVPPPISTDENDEADAGHKSRQTIVNLIGVDARRISDFCNVNNFFPGSVFKLIVSFAFLIQLIGWKSLLAGLGTMAVIFPINIMFSRWYSDAQDRLMKTRDVKLAVVNEALQGMKQIKWTATEKQWQAKIGKVRERELKDLWSALLNDTGLMLCWIASPIMLSAASLATYAVLEGGLSPSIAFTSIGIFKQVSERFAS